MPTTNEYLPHAGAVWARAVALFSGSTPFADRTLTFSITTIDGWRVLNVGYTTPSTFVNVNLYDMYQSDAELYNFSFIQTLPGIRNMPNTMAKETSGINLLDKYINTVSTCRQNWMAAITGWTYTYLLDTDWTVANPNVRARAVVWAIRKKLNFGTDWIAAQASNDAVTPAGLLNAVPSAQGQPATVPVAVVGGGGAEIDTAGIVEALNDIALRDVDYTANNGSAIFSMRGKVNI